MELPVGPEPINRSNNYMTILERIVETKKKEISSRKKENKSLSVGMKSTISFREAVSTSEIQIISEIKKASPSRGILIEDFQPVELAKQYASGGAVAFSVLTDEPYFQGHLSHLQSVAELQLAPCIRKDFIIDPIQVEDAIISGAAAILLIAGILSDIQLKELHHMATSNQIDVLIEVHTKEELDRVLTIEQPIVGINSRDLHTFKVDLNTAIQLKKYIPNEIIAVAESGIFTRSDMIRLEDVGFSAALIGESLVISGNPEKKIRELLGRD